MELMPEVFAPILKGIVSFVEALDWTFLLLTTFVGHVLLKEGMLESIKPSWLRNLVLRIPQAWRFIILGTIIGVIYIWLDNDYTRIKIKSMLITLFVTMAIHKLVLEKFFGIAEDKIKDMKEKRKARKEEEKLNAEADAGG